MIKENDKCVITNNTTSKIDLPLFRQNFKWRLNPNDTLEFPINSAEQGLFYLKQKVLGLSVTIGESNKV